MPTKEAKATLNDIGTEELAHLEMIGTMVHQLMDKFSKSLKSSMLIQIMLLRQSCLSFRF